jgi:hypothetical protein
MSVYTTKETLTSPIHDPRLSRELSAESIADTESFLPMAKRSIKL